MSGVTISKQASRLAGIDHVVERAFALIHALISSSPLKCGPRFPRGQAERTVAALFCVASSGGAHRLVSSLGTLQGCDSVTAPAGPHCLTTENTVSVAAVEHLLQPRRGARFAPKPVAIENDTPPGVEIELRIAHEVAVAP
jgi:hypothetical protein